MYKRILVPVSRSETTGRLLGAAQELASSSGGEVWVLHLRKPETSPRNGLTARPTASQAQVLATAAVRNLSAAGIQAHGEVRLTPPGQLAHEIANAVMEHDADVIIMASPGGGFLADLRHGTITRKVIRLADRPVLLIR